MSNKARKNCDGLKWNDINIPEVIMADLIAALLHLGCMALRSAHDAAICGHDIEVPDRRLYLATRWSLSNFVGDDASLHAANIYTPGAVISGCPTKPSQFNNVIKTEPDQITKLVTPHFYYCNVNVKSYYKFLKVI